jgi:hypothetical protein
VNPGLLQFAAFLLLTAALCLPGYLVLSGRKSAWEALPVGYFVTVSTLHVAVLLLCTYLQRPLTWGFTAGASAIGFASFWVTLKHRQGLGRILGYGAGVLVVFLILSALFTFPFSRSTPYEEDFDFFVYIGFLMKRFFETNHVPSKNSLYDYSAYNYPILNPVWSLPYYALLKNELIIRYKSMLFFPFSALIAVGLMFQRPFRSLGLALLSVCALMMVGYRKQWVVPDFFYTGYTDLPFAMFMVLCLVYYFRAVRPEAQKTDLALCWMFSFLVSQMKYDGLFFHAGCVLATIAALWSSEAWKERRWSYLTFAGLVGASPLVWIIYEKVFLGSPGSFQKLATATGFRMFGGVLLHLLRPYAVWGVVAAATVLLGAWLWRREGSPRKILALLPILFYAAFLIFIFGAAWRENWVTESYYWRLVPRLFPVLILCGLYFLFEAFSTTRIESGYRWAACGLGAALIVFLAARINRSLWIVGRQFSTPLRAPLPDYGCVDRFRQIGERFDFMLVSHPAMPSDEFHKYVYYRYELYPQPLDINDKKDRLANFAAKRWVLLDGDARVIHTYRGDKIPCL